MRDLTQPGALPLRPLTTGELLDAAVVLVRLRGWRLLLLGACFALAEQLVLFPLRRWADVDSSYFPGDDLLFQYGVLIVVSIFTEVFCIAVLGGVGARLAPKALLGWAAPAKPRPSRWAAVTVVSLIAGVLCASTAWSFLVFPVPLQVLGLVIAFFITAALWPFVYGLLGLTAPVVVTDERGPVRAVGRGFRLAASNGMRAAWIRVLGYVAWLFIRLGLGLATVALINLAFTSPSSTVDNLIMGATWLVVNAIAYPTLGCLDVALHLEARMRTEGLDLALRRSIRRGVAPDLAPGSARNLADASLAVPR